MREGQDRRSARAVFWAGILALIFGAGSFLAPLIENVSPAAGGLLRLSYAPLCHQMPDRSLQIARGTQAVCARCSGLYLGGVAGLLAGAALLARRRLAPRPAWLLCAATPTALDFLAGQAGLLSLGNLPRLLLALPLGLVATLYLAVGVADLCSFTKRTRFGSGDSPVLEEPNG